MGQVLYAICCLFTLLGGVWSCPVECTCSQNVIIDFQVGVDVDCSGLYLDNLPSISGGALRLDFSSNHLEEIPDRINLLTELRVLDLAKNRLSPTIADNLFSTLVNLKVLNLSENYLTDFTLNTFNGLSRLEKLDLHGNYISQLPLGLLQSLPTTIIAVCLGDNKWDCERCEFRNTLKGYLRYEQNELTNYCHREVPTCFSPPSLEGRALTEVSLEEIPECPEENSKTTPWNFISTTLDISTELSTITDELPNLFGSVNPHTTTNLSEDSDGKTSKVVTVTPHLPTAVGKTSPDTPMISTPRQDNPQESNEEKNLGEKTGFSSNQNVSGDYDNKGYSQLFIAAAIVILGVILLIIFIVFSIMLWKMQSKSKKETISCTTPSTGSFLKVSDWPLLQGRQLPATAEPASVASSDGTEYEEIPYSQGDNFDGYVTRKEVSKTGSDKPNVQPGAAKKGFELYSVKIDNPDNNMLFMQSNPTMTRLHLQASQNESIAIECTSSDTTDDTDLNGNAPYMEMRSSVAAEVVVKDLYAPLGT